MRTTQGLRNYTDLTTPKPLNHTHIQNNLGLWGQITLLTELALRTESSASYEALTLRIERIKFLSSSRKQKENML